MKQDVDEWTVIVPVRSFATAKSRLRRSLVEHGVDADVDGLARAFAADVVSACARAQCVDQTIVLTDRLGPEFAGIGATVWQQESDLSDFNQILQAAVERVRREDANRSTAIVVGDLPCVTGDDFDAVLRADSAPSFIRDQAGTGTTVVMVPAKHSVYLRFGIDSASGHNDTMRDLTAIAPAGIRHDVDSYADLRSAMQLSVGSATAAALRNIF